MTGPNSILDVMLYLANRPWKFSLEKSEYEDILSSEVKDVLSSMCDVFESRHLDLLFAIIWNDLARDWFKHTPFLSSKDATHQIKKYMWLQTTLGIKGPTRFVFDRLVAPCMVLTFELGDKADIHARLDHGILVVRVVLSSSMETYRFVQGIPFQDADLPQKIGEVSGDVYILEVGESRSKPSQSTHLDSYVARDLSDSGYVAFLDRVVRALDGRTRRRQHETELGDKLRKDLHKSLALIYTILCDIGAERQVAYFFNSSNAFATGRSTVSVEFQDGGCFAVVAPVQELRDIRREMYALASLTLTKLSSAQKVFRSHSERTYALRSGFAAIMSRNLSHNLGSHGLTHLIDGRWGDEYDHCEGSPFLTHLKARMDFIAEITTYWREITWLER